MIVTPAAASPVRVAAFGAADAAPPMAAWRTLAAQGDDRNPFWEPAFALPAATLPGVAPPLFVACWRGERMTALLALERPRLGAASPLLRAWSHDQAVLGAPLLDPLHGAEDIGVALRWLQSRHRLAGALLWRWMPEDGPAAAALAAAGARPVRLDAHERAALANASPLPVKKRKELGRLRRRLAEQGRLESVSAAAPDDVETACTAFAALEARGWKGRRGSAFASHPDRLRFLQAVTQGLARDGGCRIDRLTLDGETIAAGVLLGGGPRALYWKTTYDERFAAFSPGVLLTVDVTDRQLADSSVRLTDSCAVAHHPMIDRLWAGRVRVSDWWIPLGPTSTAMLATERARRALRATAKRMLGRG
ncbi:hypothetical protein GCM10007036_42540 [Alsobacter metallidurans]|uniref:BioF2-like acetyltransferase domain-containing protein n=1 Tax=Alsobacter metallidurans TaxID=340221 RepID=A0A917IAS4_9HYPH|nr:GNAT family N-acetyltransferase [Alsobacter metallidurans]GGH31380.1 hypothetical protein GCM10007036_42540 [Alsobacter metallidurans]